MEKWYAKARLAFPEVISGENQSMYNHNPTMYGLWFDLLRLTQEAHEKNDVNLLKRVYPLAEWFFYSTEEDYSNCVVVSFYEHLIDCDKTLEGISNWVSKDIIEKVMPLWKLRSKHHPKQYAKLEMLMDK